SRIPVRCASAWRHGRWHRPRHHASGRREEPARNLAVPDESAGARPPDERAFGCDARATARPPYPSGSGTEELSGITERKNPALSRVFYQLREKARWKCTGLFSFWGASD